LIVRSIPEDGMPPVGRSMARLRPWLSII
jgi:hypothetical protein